MMDMGYTKLEGVWTKRIGLALCLVAGACDSEAPETFQELELRSGTLSGGSGGFINNGLEDPKISGIDPDFALDTEAGLRASKLSHVSRLATARYTVECALPLGESVTKVVNGVQVVLDGALGLAPEWQDGTCDEDCQEWVSACLLARTNVSGQTVGLWLNADHPALGFGANPSYPNYEASFFGNLFADDDTGYLCTGSGSGPVLAQLDGRTCSSGDFCGFTAYTDCEAVQRCELVDTDAGPAAIDCQPGNVPNGVGMRTISTYVATPAS
jgi:hypothetical protein